MPANQGADSHGLRALLPLEDKDPLSLFLTGKYQMPVTSCQLYFRQAKLKFSKNFLKISSKFCSFQKGAVSCFLSSLCSFALVLIFWPPVNSHLVECQRQSNRREVILFLSRLRGFQYSQDFSYFLRRHNHQQLHIRQLTPSLLFRAFLRVCLDTIIDPMPVKTWNISDNNSDLFSCAIFRNRASVLQ